MQISFPGPDGNMITVADTRREPVLVKPTKRSHHRSSARASAVVPHHRLHEGLTSVRLSERRLLDLTDIASDSLNSSYSDRIYPGGRNPSPRLALSIGSRHHARRPSDRSRPHRHFLLGGLPPQFAQSRRGPRQGLSDAAACISATMEALEGAVAEAPVGRRRIAAADTLDEEGQGWLSPERWLPHGTAFDTTRAIVDRGHRSSDPLHPAGCRSTSSTWTASAATWPASARTPTASPPAIPVDEASFHALCELVERDATTLWSFISEAAAHATAIDPAAFGDAVIDGLVAQIAASGMDHPPFRPDLRPRYPRDHGRARPGQPQGLRRRARGHRRVTGPIPSPAAPPFAPSPKRPRAVSPRSPPRATTSTPPPSTPPPPT